MSWLWGTPTVAKICPKDTFYFITPGHNQKGWFRMSSWNGIQITDKSICDFPKDGQCVIVPRNIIDKINPKTDFTAKIRICHHGETTLCSERPLGEVMLDNVTFGNTEQMTWAMMASGEWCVNMDKDILVVCHGLVIPKFDCKDIMEQLCRCLNQAVCNYSRYTTADMVLECKEKELSIHVSIGLSENLRKILTGKEVGSVKIMDKEKAKAKVESTGEKIIE